MKSVVLIFLAFISVFAVSAQNQESGLLKVGAAKIDVTPAPDALPEIGYPRGIRDHIHVRAIVIDNEITKAAFISVEIDGIGTATFPAIEEATGIPADNIIISPTHTHSSIQLPRGKCSGCRSKQSSFCS